MKITFWGVRGSIASPGPDTVRYGGNTTCIEIRTDSNELIIIDAGTGLFPLSRSLMGELPITANVLITHSHWDHIQGLPFFLPNFIPGNTMRLHGAFDPIAGRGIEHVMAVQLQHSYFPVHESDLTARIEYVNLLPEQRVQIGSASVTPYLMSHPVINFGYRVESHGKSVFFTGDHEPLRNPHALHHPDYAACQRSVDKQTAYLVQAMAGVDVLIADCSYTREEYPYKIGWGHGTFDSSIAYARQAGVGVLFCTHHEPTRSVDALERVFNQALADHPRKAGDPGYRLAYEGLSYTF